MKFITTKNFMPFVIYRVLLGVLLFVLVAAGVLSPHAGVGGLSRPAAPGGPTGPPGGQRLARRRARYPPRTIPATRVTASTAQSGRATVETHSRMATEPVFTAMNQIASPVSTRIPMVRTRTFRPLTVRVGGACGPDVFCAIRPVSSRSADQS